MTETEVALFQALVELREQLSSDYSGDHSDMKALVDKRLIQLLNKNV